MGDQHDSLRDDQSKEPKGKVTSLKFQGPAMFLAFWCSFVFRCQSLGVMGLIVLNSALLPFTSKFLGRKTPGRQVRLDSETSLPEIPSSYDWHLESLGCPQERHPL